MPFGQGMNPMMGMNQDPTMMLIQSILAPPQMQPIEPDPAILQQIDQAPVYQETVPGGVNPFAAMGSTFAATLADQLGARGAMAMNEGRLRERQDMTTGAELRNVARNERAFADRQLKRLQYLQQVDEAKAKQAEMMGDFEMKAKLEQAQFARELRMQQIEEKAQEKDRAASIAGQLAVAKEYGKNRADKSTTAPEDATSEVLRFNENIESIWTRAGATQDEKVETGEKNFLGLAKKREAKVLTPEAASDIRNRSWNTLTNSGVKPQVKEAALKAYLDTYRQGGQIKSGLVNKDQRLAAMILNLYPDPVERAKFFAEVGVVK